MPEKQQGQTKFLGPLALALISVSAIISLRNLPLTAIQGTKAITFFLVAGIFFFIPIALACAELASGWPKKGGIYLWTREAFGPHWGVFTIWLEWSGSVVWLPAVLAFLASTTGYLFSPELEFNKIFMIAAMMVYLWGATFLNFFGIKTSSLVSTIGVVLGTLFPVAVLICLGSSYFAEGIAFGRIDFSLEGVLPSGNMSSLVTITALLLAFAGMEIPAYYVQSVENPRRDYPRAMFLATAIILAASILGSLAISTTIPKEEISLVGGTMQSFHVFFSKFSMTWATPMIAGFMLIGGFSLLNTWIIGPSRGLLASAEEGDIPSVFQHTNQKEVPTTLLVFQAIIGTLLTSVYVFNPSIKAAFWILNTLAAQIYLIMYAMVFLAVIKLRYSMPHVPRPYQIPGGKLGVWLIAGSGVFSCVLAILIGFARPEEFDVHINAVEYTTLLGIGMILFCLPPVVYRWLR